jgi:hypothetical protein
MAKLTLGSETIDIAPFGLDKLERAADDIDAVNAALANRDGTWKSMISSYRPVMKIAAIGQADDVSSLSDEDIEKAADGLMKKATMRDAAAIFGFFTAILEDTGLTSPGETKPGTAEAAQPSADQQSSESESRSDNNSEN